MATGSQVDLVNRALLAVGARTQVSSINPSDGSAEGNAAAVLWTPTFEALARTSQWNCLRKQQQLSMIAAASGTPENPDGTVMPLPPIPWLYEYALPSDCLRMWWIVPSWPFYSGSSSTPQTSVNNVAGPWLPSSGAIPYQVAYGQDPNGNPILTVLTNQDQAIGVYCTNQPNPQGWDSLFQAAFVASLAAYLVPALSLDLPLMQMCIKTAEAQIATARAMDGNEGTTTMDHLPDWIAARAGAQGYGLGYNFTMWGGVVNMVWPSGYYD